MKFAQNQIELNPGNVLSTPTLAGRQQWYKDSNHAGRMDDDGGTRGTTRRKGAQETHSQRLLGYHTVPFQSIRQSRVTGPSKTAKRHGSHGNFRKVTNSFDDYVPNIEIFRRLRR